MVGAARERVPAGGEDGTGRGGCAPAGSGAAEGRGKGVAGRRGREEPATGARGDFGAGVWRVTKWRELEGYAPGERPRFRAPADATPPAWGIGGPDGNPACAVLAYWEQAGGYNAVVRAGGGCFKARLEPGEPPPGDELLTINGASFLSGLPKSTLTTAMQRGTIRRARVHERGRDRFVRRDELHRYLMDRLARGYRPPPRHYVPPRQG